MFLQQYNVTGFLNICTLSNLTFLVTQAVQNMVPYHGRILKSNRIIVGYSHNFHATIAPALLFRQVTYRLKGWKLGQCLPFSPGRVLCTFQDHELVILDEDSDQAATCFLCFQCVIQMSSQIEPYYQFVESKQQP